MESCLIRVTICAFYQTARDDFPLLAPLPITCPLLCRQRGGSLTECDKSYVSYPFVLRLWVCLCRDTMTLKPGWWRTESSSTGGNLVDIESWILQIPFQYAWLYRSVWLTLFIAVTFCGSIRYCIEVCDRLCLSLSLSAAAFGTVSKCVIGFVYRCHFLRQKSGQGFVGHPGAVVSDVHRMILSDSYFSDAR